MPNPLLRGFRLTLRHPGPVLWLYALSLIIAWLTSIGLRVQYGNVTNASLASQRLIGSFDLGVALDASRRLADGPSGSLTPSFLTTPIYLLIAFILLPGILAIYQANTSLRLGYLILRGTRLFWTFVRVTLWTLLIGGPILALCSALRGAIATRIDATLTGKPAFLASLALTILLLLVAALLRLYFDIVEAHVVVRDLLLPLPNNKRDRRTRKSLRTALDTLRLRFLANYVAFVVPLILALATTFLLTRSALRHLAQPRVWPTFLLAQLSVFLLIFTRLWQRAAATVMVQNHIPEVPRTRIFTPTNPAPLPAVEPPMTHSASSFPTPAPDNPVSPILPGPPSDPFPEPPPTPDPLPSMEPIAPSLASPDTGVFQHDVNPKKDLIN